MEGEGFQLRYASFMDTMFKSAVAETTKLFETMVDDLKNEISRIKKENEDLKSKCNEYENMKKQPTCDGEQRDPMPGPSHAADKQDTGVQCDLITLQSILEEHGQMEEGSQKEKGHYLENPIGENSPMAFIVVKHEESDPVQYMLVKQEDDETLLVPRFVSQSETSESLGFSELPSVSQPSSCGQFCSLQNDQEAPDETSTPVHIQLYRENEQTQFITIPEVKGNMTEHAEVSRLIPETLALFEKLPEVNIQLEVLKNKPAIQRLEEQQSAATLSVQIDNEMSVNKQFSYVPSTLVLPEVVPISKTQSPEVEFKAKSQPDSIKRRKRGRPSKKATLCESQQQPVEEEGSLRSTFFSISQQPSFNKPFSCQTDQIISEIPQTACIALDSSLNCTRGAKIQRPETNHPSVFTLSTVKDNMTNNSKVTEISAPSETPEDMKKLAEEQHLEGDVYHLTVEKPEEVELREMKAKSHPDSSKYKRGQPTKKDTFFSLKSVIGPYNTQQESVNTPSTCERQCLLQKDQITPEDFETHRMALDNVITCERGFQEQLPEPGHMPFVMHPAVKDNLREDFKFTQSKMEMKREDFKCIERAVVVADKQSLVQPSKNEQPSMRTHRQNESSTPEQRLEATQKGNTLGKLNIQAKSSRRRIRPPKRCKTSLQQPVEGKVCSQSTDVSTEQKSNISSNSVKSTDVLSQPRITPLKRGQAPAKKRSPKSLSHSSAQINPSESKQITMKIKKRVIQSSSIPLPSSNETVETLTSESPKAPIREPLTSYPSLQDAMLFLDAINSQCHIQETVRTPTKIWNSPTLITSQTDSVAIDHMYSQTTSNLHAMDLSAMDQSSAQQCTTTSAQTVGSSVQKSSIVASVQLQAAVKPTIQDDPNPILSKSPTSAVISGLATQTSVLSQHPSHPNITSITPVTPKKIIVVPKRVVSTDPTQACNLLPHSKADVTPSALSNSSIVVHPKTVSSMESGLSPTPQTVVPSSDHLSRKVIIIMSGSMPTVVVRQQPSPVAPQAITLPVQEPPAESPLTATVSSDQQLDVAVTKPTESLAPSVPLSQKTSDQQISFSSQQLDVTVTKPTEPLEPSIPVSLKASDQQIRFSSQQLDVTVTKPTEPLEPSIPVSLKASDQQIRFSSQQSDVAVTKPTASVESTLLSEGASDQELSFSSQQSDVAVTEPKESVESSLCESSSDQVLDLSLRSSASVHSTIPLSQSLDICDNLGSYGTDYKVTALSACSSLKNMISPELAHVYLSPDASSFFHNKTYPVVLLLKLPITSEQVSPPSSKTETNPSTVHSQTQEKPVKPPNLFTASTRGTAPAIAAKINSAFKAPTTINQQVPTCEPSVKESVPYSKTSTLSSENLSELNESSVKCGKTFAPIKISAVPTQVNYPGSNLSSLPEVTNGQSKLPLTKCMQASTPPMEPTVLQEEVSVVKLTSFSKETSDPHLGMTKTQFLAQLAVSPVADIQKTVLPNDAVGTRAIGQATSTSQLHQDSVIARLRQLSRSPLKTKNIDTGPEPTVCSEKPRSKAKNGATPKDITSEPRKTNDAPINARVSDFSDSESMTEHYSVHPRRCRLIKDGPSTEVKTNEHISVSLRKPEKANCEPTFYAKRHKIDEDGHGSKRSNDATPAKKPRVIPGSTSTKNINLKNSKKLTKPAKAKTLAKIKRSHQSHNSAEASPSTKNLASHENQKMAKSKAVWIPPIVVAKKSQLTRVRTSSLPTKTEPRPQNQTRVKTPKRQARSTSPRFRIPQSPNSQKNQTQVKTPKRQARSTSPRFRITQSPTSQNQSQKVIPIYGPKTRSYSSRRNVYGPSVSQYPIPVKAPPMVSPLQPLSVIGWRLLKNQCGECGCILSNSAELEKHVSLHIRSHPFSCHLCGKIFPDSMCLKRHGRVHRNGRIHICQQCGKGFVYSFGLTKHLQMVHAKIRPFSCQYCSKGFFTKRDAEAHERVHTGEKPFPCNLCEKRFKRRVELNMHLRWHNGEKRHWCQFCGKGFLDFNNLKRHKMIHTGEKPCICSHCPKKFTQSGHLKKHLRNVHKVKC